MLVPPPSLFVRPCCCSALSVFLLSHLTPRFLETHTSLLFTAHLHIHCYHSHTLLVSSFPMLAHIRCCHSHTLLVSSCPVLAHICRCHFCNLVDSISRSLTHTSATYHFATSSRTSLTRSIHRYLPIIVTISCTLSSPSHSSTLSCTSSLPHILLGLYL